MSAAAQGPFSVREARDEDSAAVIAVIATVFAEYPGCVLDVDREEPELRAPASSFERFWVVERANRVVGFCGLASRVGEDGAPVTLLKKLYLLPEARGQGLSRVLIERVEEHARARGSSAVELWSDTRFATAHAVYRHLGYVHGGRTRELGDLSRTTEWHFAKRLAHPSLTKSRRSSAEPGRRILVVDDSIDGAAILATLLSFMGHEVRLAHDGPAALDVVRSFVPDLALLDIGLPGMNGYELAGRIRAEPGLERVMLVAQTGWGAEEDRLRSREAGFDEHLVKPIEPRAVLEIISRLPS